MFAGKVTVSGDSVIDPMQIIHDAFESDIVEQTEHARYRYHRQTLATVLNRTC